MPVLLTEKPAPYETIPNRIRWTRQKCDVMRDAGLLTGHFELVDGEILSKMGQNPPHAYVLSALLTWLAGVFGIETVRIQTTLDVSETNPDYDEPEPDAVVTAQPYTAYAGRHPVPIDLALLVEVSDSTLRFDLNTKAILYARAAIQEYWVIDIAGRQAFVHRYPSHVGYGEILVYSAEEITATLARPDASIRVADLLPIE